MGFHPFIARKLDCSIFRRRVILHSVMKHSDFVDRITASNELLQSLTPAQPADTETLLRIRAATDDEISGGKPLANAPLFPLARAGLLYLIDAIDESHRIVKDVPGDESAYWHGMIHRREGDFDNARYWFRRAGVLPVFGELHAAAAKICPSMAAQMNWDPYLFTGLCEQEKFGDRDHHDELVGLQRPEFDTLFDYCWRGSVGVS
jgi:hypothetical protein